MAGEPLHVGLLYGSVRAGRFCDKVAAWAVGEIERHDGFTVDPIDPKPLALPAWHGDMAEGDLAALRRRLAVADGFVVVTPEYNHAYPAVLKALIDTGKREWEAKPVAFVSYGGLAGGLRAVEQLRLVFAELHAVTVRDTVSFHNPWRRFDETGRLSEPDAPAEAMAVMLSSLAWWGRALRDARLRMPYRDRAA